MKFAVLLSGCGVYDGAEVNEAVLTLLALEEHNISYDTFAPDRDQHHVINHLNGEEQVQNRNVLQESARIVRGNIAPLNDLNPADYDAVVVPGGFGVAKNLCNFAFKGADMAVQDDILSALKAFAGRNTPAGYMCIAPVMLPTIYGKGVQCTIGDDLDTAAAIAQMGGEHQNSTVSGAVVDAERRVVTTSAYMQAQSLLDARSGINALVDGLVRLVNG